MVVIGHAGAPGSWQARLHARAVISERWRVVEVPGPLPWVDPDDLVEQQALLTASEYARRHLNVWAQAEDQLASRDDVAACTDHRPRPLPYDRAWRYVCTLDIGVVNDRTVACVAHREPGPDGTPVTVVDSLHLWAGTRARPVDLVDVERTVVEMCRAYRAPLRFDPHQAAMLGQRVTAHGVRATPWQFSAGSVGRLGVALHLALRNRTLRVPADDTLADELLNVKLRPTGVPGQLRLDHDPGRHDDQAVAIGMACLLLEEGSMVRPSRVGTAAGLHLPAPPLRTGPGGRHRPSFPGRR